MPEGIELGGLGAAWAFCGFVLGGFAGGWGCFSPHRDGQGRFGLSGL